MCPWNGPAAAAEEEGEEGEELAYDSKLTQEER